MARILLVDDDESLRGVLQFALETEGYEVETAVNGEEALLARQSFDPALILTDLKMPVMDGMTLLRRLREEGDLVPVVVLTAFGSIEQAVEAMKLGAFSYLTKPYNRDELRIVLRNALEREALRSENDNLREQLREGADEVDMVYVSPVMESVVETIRRIAPTDAAILISGESGTGKEVAARSIHRLSDRWDKPLIVVNCGALPRELIESELFGHRKGAFTGATINKKGKFQIASGGTLFLDEIGELPLELQAKLLRVLETGEIDPLGSEVTVAVDVRVVAASNRDLQTMVEEGSFREDLYYRLNVIPLHIPPLRVRRDDISALWRHFISLYGKGAAIGSEQILLERLTALPWRGNVRELANLCQRMIVLRTGNMLRLKDAPPEVRALPAAGRPEAIDELLPELPEGRLPLWDVERELIRRALAKFDGNQSRTAAYLDIPRHVLIYRIDKYELKR